MQEQNNAPGKMQLTFHNLHCALNGVLLIECKVIELQCVRRSHACISNNIKEESCLLCRSLSACAQQKMTAYRCEDCTISFQNGIALRNHLHTKIHRENGELVICLHFKD